MRDTNEMEIQFDSKSCNEGFARVAVASFLTQMNPTVEEVADVKLLSERSAYQVEGCEPS